MSDVTGCRENSGVGLHKFHCIYKYIYIHLCVFSSWILKHNTSDILRAVRFTLVGETGVSGENYRPVQITDKLNHNFSYDTVCTDWIQDVCRCLDNTTMYHKWPPMWIVSLPIKIVQACISHTDYLFAFVT